jgi:long-chain acyl-CoA synthetase
MELSFRTLNEAFLERTTGASRSRIYLQHKPKRGASYQSITFAQFGERVRALAAALHHAGIRRGDRIALISESRPEWVTLDFAALAIGAITVPTFPTLTQKQVEHILVDSGAKIAFVSNDLQLSKVVKSLDAARELQSVVVFNDSFNSISSVLSSGILTLKDFVARHVAAGGFDFEQAARQADPDDTITIIYTSGTTGLPKGVMLTHRNLLANINGALAMLPPVTEEDVFLSFLPLSHSFERVASYLIFARGVQVAYAESIDTVADNMLEIRPTIMTGVPRFYERIYSRICRSKEKMAPLRRKIFEWGQSIGNEAGRSFEGESPRLQMKILSPLADALVLKKVRARTGGRIRFFVSGGAALPPEVGRAFAGFGLMVIEGYGMTESSPIISVTPHERIKWGSVGKALPNIEVKIAADGEILTRGPHVMKGYYNAPEDTREIIDQDGWLHTGDIGQMDVEGYIKITDRKKHLLVSSGGKNIAPGPIESLIAQSQFIDQVMLVGDRRQFCTALIVPDFDFVREYLRSQGLNGVTSTDELVEREEVRELIEQQIEQFQRDVASYERVRKFALLKEPFTVENSLMTPTLKIKRKEVERRYAALIEELYQDSRSTAAV